MNLRQMQYAVAAAEAKSFSEAAEQLNISQPALSKHIISLEKTLGVKLFDRATTPLTLTPAGEFFIKKAKKLLYEEESLQKTMEKYKSGESGRLTIGIAPFRSLYLMPPLIGALKERFPSLQVTLSEYSSAILRKGMLDGLYDFAIMNLPVDESVFEAIPLESDTLVLAVPEHLLPLLKKTPVPESISLFDFEDLPFIALSSGQELRKLFDRLCALSGIQPDIAVEVVGVTTAWTMVKAGLGAAVLPRQMLQAEATDGITLFPLTGIPYARRPAVIFRRGQYVSPFAEYAVSVLTGSSRE